VFADARVTPGANYPVVTGDCYLEVRPACPYAQTMLSEALVHGPADEHAFRGIAERHAGKRLHGYEAYGGNQYAEDGALNTRSGQCSAHSKRNRRHESNHVCESTAGSGAVR
jgi:hypothetical protein